MFAACREGGGQTQNRCVIILDEETSTGSLVSCIFMVYMCMDLILGCSSFMLFWKYNYGIYFSSGQDVGIQSSLFTRDGGLGEITISLQKLHEPPIRI